jgi:ferritin-like metal-binding protein YciE
MASSFRDLYVTGLVNAHAVENQALQLMQRQVERLENYPEMAQRLRTHIDETRRQEARLEEILQSLGTSHSSFKDVGLSIMGNLAAMGHAATQDEVIKNSLANFAFENYEVATYRSLLTMAEVAGDPSGPRLLQESLKEEMDMAKWIEDHLDATTRRYMQLEAKGQKAGV